MCIRDSPNIYLNAALARAARRIKNIQSAAMFDADYADAINDLRTDARAERLGGGTLTMSITGAR
jgi:hypothetical protein